MAITFDFTSIDNMLNGIGSIIEGFVMIVTLVLNNILFLLMFCFFIAFIWAVLKIFDFRRYEQKGNIDRGKKNW